MQPSTLGRLGHGHMLMEALFWYVQIHICTLVTWTSTFVQTSGFIPMLALEVLAAKVLLSLGSHRRLGGGWTGGFRARPTVTGH